MPFIPHHSPPKNANVTRSCHQLSPEERDQRTLLVMQIARDTRPRDLEEFFSSVGAVRDVRIITDSQTGPSSGICYVEFWDEESVPLGLALNGQMLMGAPLQIQRTCAERNRAANSSMASTLGFVAPGAAKGPAHVLVENLHPKITENMIREIFESFGRIEKLEQLSNGDNRETAVIMFRNADGAQKSIEQLNNFELAGRQIRLSIKADTQAPPQIQKEEASIHQRSLDDVGDLSQLMTKMAVGTGSGIVQMTNEEFNTECGTISFRFPQWKYHSEEGNVFLVYNGGVAEESADQFETKDDEEWVEVTVETAESSGQVYATDIHQCSMKLIYDAKYKLPSIQIQCLNRNCEPMTLGEVNKTFESIDMVKTNHPNWQQFDNHRFSKIMTSAYGLSTSADGKYLHDKKKLPLYLTLCQYIYPRLRLLSFTPFPRM